MAYAIPVSSDGLTMTCIYKGDVTLAEMTRSVEDRLSFGGGTVFSKIRFSVGDYTEANMRLLSKSDIAMMAKMANGAVTKNPEVVIIGIMPGDLEFGISRMLQAKTDRLSIRSFVVRSREECETLIASLLGSQEAEGEDIF